MLNIDRDLDILLSSSDIALLMYISRGRFIVRIMHRVGQSMIANRDYRKAEWASDRDADYKMAQIYRIIDRYMDLYGRMVAIYNVVAAMCMHRRAIWHFINV